MNHYLVHLIGRLHTRQSPFPVPTHPRTVVTTAGNTTRACFGYPGGGGGGHGAVSAMAVAEKHCLMLLLAVGSCCMYMMRFNTTIALSREDFVDQHRWSNLQSGSVLGGFFYGYVATQWPGGWLASKCESPTLIYIQLDAWH